MSKHSSFISNVTSDSPSLSECNDWEHVSQLSTSQGPTADTTSPQRTPQNTAELQRESTGVNAAEASWVQSISSRPFYPPGLGSQTGTSESGFELTGSEADTEIATLAASEAVKDATKAVQVKRRDNFFGSEKTLFSSVLRRPRLRVWRQTTHGTMPWRMRSGRDWWRRGDRLI